MVYNNGGIVNSLDLIEQKAALVASNRKLLDGADGVDFTPEQNDEWNRSINQVEELNVKIRQLERKEKIEALEGEQNRIQPRKTSPSQPIASNRSITKSDRNKALKAWMGYGSPTNIRYDGDTFNRCSEAGYAVNNNSITMRSMNTASAGAGGNSTFTTTYPDLQTEMKYFSPIIGKVNVQNTDNGNNFVFPRGSDVANTMAIVAQSGASGTSTDPTFDKVTLGAYTFRYVEQITYEMLQDAVFDVEGWLTSRLAERAARTLEKYMVAGTGSSQPTGLVAACVAADGGTPAVTLAAGKKSIDNFGTQVFPLIQAVDLAYRPNCTLVLNDTSVWDFRRIVDGQGRFIWDINNQLAQNQKPEKVAGWNYLVSNSIDASNAFSKNLALFVDLSRYVLRMVDGIQITRLNELYRGNGMIGFEILMRFDGNYIGHASSIARLATPAS